MAAASRRGLPRRRCHPGAECTLNQKAPFVRRPPAVDTADTDHPASAVEEKS